MKEENAVQLFEDKQVRSIWDAENEKYYVSIIDMVAILTDSLDANATGASSSNA